MDGGGAAASGGDARSRCGIQRPRPTRTSASRPRVHGRETQKYVLGPAGPSTSPCGSAATSGVVFFLACSALISAPCHEV
ncbi:hypothetical protein ZWY2020_045452 [Hordeum vulgare]|nr:hypothetical protein ZWY2020_045452 [Hordeum vulgare]